MKKVISILLIFCMVFVPVSGFAVDSVDVPIAYLTDETGNKQAVVGYLVDTQPYSRSVSEQGYARTYAYPLQLRGSGSYSEEDTDGSVSVTVYSTIYYSTKVESGTQADLYLLTKVSGNWEILDSSVSVTSASVEYGCVGTVPQNALSQRATKTVKNNFSINTGFSKYIRSEALASLGMNTKVNLKQVKGGSTRTWSFSTGNHLFNN